MASVVQQHRERWITNGKRAANLALLGATDGLTYANAALGEDEDILRAQAEARAWDCAAIRARHGSPEAALQAMQTFARRRGVKPPKVGGRITVTGAVARLSDYRWWRRALRTFIARDMESIAIKLGLVHPHKAKYASDSAVKRRRAQKTRIRDLLASLIATNELGESFSLEELCEHSISNPKIRRGELMVRLRGFEEVACERGGVGVFYTITCPGRMHARLAASGAENPSYDGTLPRDAQKYLAKLWARARAKIRRKGIYVYGFRVAEPHADGTPHWHMLLFIAPEHRTAVDAILREYALQEDGNEPGASKHRFRAESN